MWEDLKHQICEWKSKNIKQDDESIINSMLALSLISHDIIMFFPRCIFPLRPPHPHNAIDVWYELVCWILPPVQAAVHISSLHGRWKRSSRVPLVLHVSVALKLLSQMFPFFDWKNNSNPRYLQWTLAATLYYLGHNSHPLNVAACTLDATWKTWLWFRQRSVYQPPARWHKS